MSNNILKEFNMNIAIDGPAGTGKTTIATLLSKRFNILYLNTGSMYRAFALYFARKYDDFDEQLVEKEASKVEIDIEYVDGKQITILNGENVEKYLREEKISMLASKISAYKTVRDSLVAMQQNIAKKQSIILDGRDIGTVVLPDADLKFFLTATSEVRAKRRVLELQEKGIDCDFNQIKADIEKRDYDDSHRQISPLRKAEDAILIDTSNLSIEEVLEKCSSYIISKDLH